MTGPGLSRPVKKTRTGRGDRIIPPAGGLCKFGLRPGVALARGQSNPFSSCRKLRGDRIRTRKLALIIRNLHLKTHKARTRSPIVTCSELLTPGAACPQTSRLRLLQSLARILSHTGEAIIRQKSVQRPKGRHAGNLALFRDHRSNVLR